MDDLPAELLHGEVPLDAPVEFALADAEPVLTLDFFSGPGELLVDAVEVVPLFFQHLVLFLELLTHPFMLFDFPGEHLVGPGQLLFVGLQALFADRGLGKAFCHVVEVLHELTDVPGGVVVQPDGEIAVADLVGGVFELVDGAGEVGACPVGQGKDHRKPQEHAEEDKSLEGAEKMLGPVNEVEGRSLGRLPGFQK